MAKDILTRKKVEENVNSWLCSIDDLYSKKLDICSDKYKELIEQIKQMTAMEYPTLYECVFGNEYDTDMIFSLGDGEYGVYYYNPDSVSNGQIVQCCFYDEDFQKLLDGKDLMEVVAPYTQYLSDIDTVHFFATLFAIMDLFDEDKFVSTDVNDVVNVA